MPTVSFLKSKVDQLFALSNHTWTEAEISEKLRRSGVMRTKNASINRNRLNLERQNAVAKHDEAEIARIDRELLALDGPKLAFGTSLNANNTVNGKLAVPKPPTQQERLAALNRANRKANAEAVRKAQIAEKRAEERAKAAVERGEAIANRFARVKTRAKVHHNFDEDDHLAPPKNKNVDDLFEESARSGTATPTPGKAANGVTPKSGTPQPKIEPKQIGSFKKKMDDDILGSLDFGIDVDI